MKKRAVLSVARARMMLLIMMVVTAARMLLRMLGASFAIPISAYIPPAVIELGSRLSEGKSIGGLIYSLATAIALLFLMVLVFLYIGSGKERFWLKGALLYYAVDAILLVIATAGAIDKMVLFNYALHACTFFYLICGILSDRKLTRIEAEEAEMQTEE